MKKCSRCGRELSEDQFNKCSSTSDGLQCRCKDCSRQANRESYLKKKGLFSLDHVDKVQHLTKIYSNPELSKFTPRELMAELKARGFRWEYMLEPQKKIMYDKI